MFRGLKLRVLQMTQKKIKKLEKEIEEKKALLIKLKKES